MSAEKGQSFLLKKAPAGATVTFTNATNICNFAAHGMSAGDAIIFTTDDTLPAELTASQVYYAGTILAGTFTMHPTKGDGVAGSSTVAITDDGSGTHTGKILTTVAGMRSTSFTINGQEVEITTKDSAGWRVLLAGAGVTQMSLTGSGVFQDDAGLQQMRVDVINKALETYTIMFESGDEYWGLFQITSVEQTGEHDGEVTYSISLENSGVVTLITNI